MANLARYMEKMDVYYGVYDDYDGRATDSQIIVIDGYGLSDKVERYLEAYCDGIEVSWNFSDSVVVDDDDNCAYDAVGGYGEVDYIVGDCEIIGRNRIETGDVTFDDIMLMFGNNSSRALPSWIEPTDGWEERSCDFANNWYGQNDDPSEILAKLQAKDLDVLFQIQSVYQFGVDFCVWTREQS